MAHAGTPTDLAKQPAASSGLWKPLLTAVVILAIGVALAMAIVVPVITGRAAVGAAVDTSYNQIEAQRGAWALSGATVDSAAVQKAAAAKAQAMSGVAPDTSYNTVDKFRALSGVTVDTDAIAKAAAAKAQAMSGVAADTSYNAAEKARSGAFSGKPTDRPVTPSIARHVGPTASSRKHGANGRGRTESGPFFMLSARGRVDLDRGRALADAVQRCDTVEVLDLLRHRGVGERRRPGPDVTRNVPRRPRLRGRSDNR